LNREVFIWIYYSKTLSVLSIKTLSIFIMRISISVLLTVFAFVCMAQLRVEEFKNIYDSATIQRYNDHRYMINKRPLSRKQLSGLLLSSSGSAMEYKAYRLKKRNAILLNVISSAGYLAGVYLLPNNPKRGLLFIGGGLFFGFVSFPIGVSSRNHLGKSIWLYNRSRLLKSFEGPGNFTQ
jgi:hypothetical protein